MLSSCMNSLRSLVWILILTACFIYLVSIVFLQLIVSDPALAQAPEVRRYFGNVGRTMLTLFEAISGGLSWDDAVYPLTCISPPMGALFCLYVSFFVFALLNVVTGVFVSKATQAARTEEISHTANLITDVFMDNIEDDIDHSEIDAQVFQQKLNSDEMQEYFADMGIDISDGKKIFNLLDSNCDGSLSPEEVVEGCLRLRGDATAFDLCLLLHECHSMHRQMVQEHHVTRELLADCIGESTSTGLPTRTVSIESFAPHPRRSLAPMQTRNRASKAMPKLHKAPSALFGRGNSGRLSKEEHSRDRGTTY